VRNCAGGALGKDFNVLRGILRIVNRELWIGSGKAEAAPRLVVANRTAVGYTYFEECEIAKTSVDLQQEAVSRQLDNLSLLSDGWDSYSAPAPVADAIVCARSLVEALVRDSYTVAHIGPSVLGGVGITVELDDAEYAIEFRNSGKAVVTIIDADSAFKVHELKEPNAFQANILSILAGDFD